MMIMRINYYIQEKEKYFRNIYNKKLDKIEELSKKTDGNNSVYTIINTGKTIDFPKKDDPLTFLNKIKKGEITIEEVKESQKDFDKYLKSLRNRKKKSWATENTSKC